MIENLINVTVQLIEAIAAVMIAASIVAAVIDIVVAAVRRGLRERTTESRLRLAERLVLSLEFLKTVVTPTLEGMAVLGAVIVIRTVLSLSIAYELRRDGHKKPESCS